MPMKSKLDRIDIIFIIGAVLVVFILFFVLYQMDKSIESSVDIIITQTESNRELQDAMFQYACRKYSQDFSVVDFNESRYCIDYRTDDSLTLCDDDGVEFKVTHNWTDNTYTDRFMDDDYSEQKEAVSLQDNSIIS